MKKQLLQHGRLLPALETSLDAQFDIHRLCNESDPSAFLRQHGSRFAGLVTSAPVGADSALISALPNLEVIASFGVGFDKLDLDVARSRGIRVSYTPDVLNDCVADLAFGLLIDVARGMSAADRFVRRGDWSAGRFPVASRVSGKRLGIVGLGRIGQTIARRASGFDMEIAYTSRTAAALPYRFEASLVALAQWADFLMVAVAGGTATEGLVSREVLAALGPTGFLINISRGSVLDEQALVEALCQRSIAGAGLDVFEKEPHIPPALLALDNVVLLPHIASATTDTRGAMGDLVLANLHAYFSTGELITPLL